ncbi:MAG: histidine kinase [Saprospiraceae bacterium]|nr:histidine kinase [Saprospiraceae bacterium]
MEMRSMAAISKLQWYAFLATSPMLWVALNYILYHNEVFHRPQIWLVSILLISLPGLIAWYAHCLLSRWLKQRFSELRQTGIRLFLQSLLLLFTVSGFTFFVFWINDQLGWLGYRWENADVKLGLLVTLGMSFLVETLYEADFNFTRYRESVEDVKSLERLAEHQEFESLKSLINPHFLFNCFNALSSLIAEDPKRAIRFLDELSKVYRYLLLSNQQSFSALENEINFIHSYYQLLKTRYGNALELNIDIAPQYNRYLIPSLSLQLLVENAVKHNIVSNDQPLVIEIFTTEGDQLIVHNNLQRKLVKAAGARIGLDSIKMKYQLLHQQGFQIIEDEKNFTVALPLVWSQSAQPETQYSPN